MLLRAFSKHVIYGLTVYPPKKMRCIPPRSERGRKCSLVYFFCERGDVGSRHLELTADVTRRADARFPGKIGENPHVFLHQGGTGFGLHGQSTRESTPLGQDFHSRFAKSKGAPMNALIAAALIVVGIGVVVVARPVSRRVEAWADAMIFSFGLLQGKDDDDSEPDNLPSRGNVSKPSDRNSTRPRRQVIVAESEEYEDGWNNDQQAEIVSELFPSRAWDTIRLRDKGVEVAGRVEEVPS